MEIAVLEFRSWLEWQPEPPTKKVADFRGRPMIPRKIQGMPDAAEVWSSRWEDGRFVPDELLFVQKYDPARKRFFIIRPDGISRDATEDEISAVVNRNKN